jgi:hypothetical protein
MEFRPIWHTKVINSKWEVAFTVCTTETRYPNSDDRDYGTAVRVGDLMDKHVGPWLHELEVRSGTMEEAWAQHAELVLRQTTEVGRLPESGRS